MRQSILRVLEWREQRSRRELARSTRAVSEINARIETLEQVIAAVEARVKTSVDERSSGGPRKVAALLELEEHARGLAAAREQVSELKRQFGGQLAQLEEQRRADAHRWRRDDVKLAHGRTLAQREALARASRRDSSSERAG